MSGFSKSAFAEVEPRHLPVPTDLQVQPNRGDKGRIIVGGILGTAVGALVLGSLSYWYHQQSCEAVNCRENGWQRGVRTTAVTGALVGGAVGIAIAWPRRE